MNGLSRRNFLGWIAGGSAGLLLPVLVKPRPVVFDMGRGMPREIAYRTIRPGRWSDPGIWEGGLIPHDRCNVVIRHDVILDHSLTNSYVTQLEGCIRTGPGAEPIVAFNVFA